MFKNAKFIWTDDNKKLNDWVIFRKEINLKDIPIKAELKIYCDTKYYLYINGEIIVFDGGLFRESTNKNGYYDSIEISNHLILGQNIIVFNVWHFGNGGRNNISCENAGLIFECENLNLISDKRTKCLRNPAHYNTQEPLPSYLYGGYNIGYNANYDIGNFTSSDFDESGFKLSTEYGSYPCAPFNECVKRPIPQIKFYDIVTCKYLKEENKYKVKLPYAMQFTPYFKVEANGNEIIDIRSDRYIINGGPGDENNHYNGHRTEYICKKGIAEFESLNWIYGEEIVFTIPENIKIIALGYRESCYDTEIKLNLKSKDEQLNKLLTKCARTLKVCMRENFMDCPDRERGQWIGDVSVQSPQVFYALDENAIKLLKKSIYDFINLRNGDILVGNIPGENSCELPGQSLNAISEFGMIATYFNKTKDIEILKLVFEPCISYLKLWYIDTDGLISKRRGNCYWFDHLYNIDEKVLENCWYYSAVKFAETMSKILCDSRFDIFILERKNAIEQNFDKVFWKGGYYASSNFVDDRANAMAIISGLADKSKYKNIRKILISVFNSTPYMEGYILEALCLMGFKEDAYKRMMSRYYNLIENQNTTLWEDFFILGTKNHAWTGAPITIIHKYFTELIV